MGKNRPWTKQDIEMLKDMVKDGKSVDVIAEYFDRTTTAIEIKVNRLGLKIERPFKWWTDEELTRFKKDWQSSDYTLKGLSKKYKRSCNSLQIKAQRMGLGARPYNEEYVSIATICHEMQVSHDRVRHWIELGLPTKKNKSGRTKYLIDVNKLLKFLEKHQELFDASKVSKFLFYKEPQWLIDKRKLGRDAYALGHRSFWTNDMDKELVVMFKSGRSDEEIAKHLDKTAKAVRARLQLLGYFRGVYNDYEIEILRKYSDYKTVYELEKLLPLRTAKSIAYKCEHLGIPYHLSEKCVKKDS